MPSPPGGLVPDTAMGRSYRDALGRVNAALAATADRVVFLSPGATWICRGNGRKRVVYRVCRRSRPSSSERSVVSVNATRRES
ncbi:MAG: bifunctional adenosylcobinamide kinase/adenosylcobinamide-phosphate guanylyltransferase [Acidimicrobiales bacterium]